MAAPVKASLTTALAGADNDLVFTSKWNAAKGNATRISYVDPGAVNCSGYVVAEDSSIDGQASRGPFIMIVIKRTIAAITMTALEVKALIEKDPVASSLVAVALSGADTGAGAIIALASTPLASGVDAAFASKAEAETIFQTISWSVDAAAELNLLMREPSGVLRENKILLSGTDASKLPILDNYYNSFARKGRSADILAL